MEKCIFFAKLPWNIIKFSFEYITKLLKSEEKDKLDRIIGIGRFLNSYYPGSLELILFITNYKINLS